MGWGTFIAGQAIRNVRRAGRKPETDWWSILHGQKEPKLTDSDLSEQKRLKAESRQQKALEDDKKSREKAMKRKLELERFRKDMKKAKAQGAEQRDSLIFKMLRVVFVILMLFFATALIMAALS